MELIFRSALKDIMSLSVDLERQEEEKKKTSMENLYREKDGIKNACDNVIKHLEEWKNL